MWKGTEVAVKVIASGRINKGMEKKFKQEVRPCTTLPTPLLRLRLSLLYCAWAIWPHLAGPTHQVRLMTTLRHPNVVLFMAASTKAPRMCIVMEYMSLGSLYEVRHDSLVLAHVTLRPDSSLTYIATPIRRARRSFCTTS